MSTAAKPIRDFSSESPKDSGYSSTSSLKSVQQMETIEAELAAENQRQNEIVMKENSEKVNQYGQGEAVRHLQTLLDRSEVYAELILARLKKEKEEKTKQEAKLLRKQNKVAIKSEVTETEKSPVKRFKINTFLRTFLR